MKIIEIPTETRGVRDKAVIECDRRMLSLSLVMESGARKTYTAHDLYFCLGLLRADFPETKFLCKGAKLNVYPSRMSSQMSSGLMAYELQLGKPAEPSDLVRIFDYEETGITTDIQQQRDFYKRWIESFPR
ncbi:hypothetical protein NTD84_21040 [Pseudomonas sp. 14P_8.1_Bac3]|uniref:hypothetical protein n=1 Tax=Pseudomonas sp. 14P_8.1_Bac3 TaxID=2971621 RepID=UPI0021C9BAE7|nr:hypothetical protein [Pseudomonas sp. 14P_8.1_Bac3]MCU1762193.1 hypothetical protein [Pseudomonas sp. 14P_8.1_Bac3]